MNLEYFFAKGSAAFAVITTATGAGAGIAVAESITPSNPYVITGAVIGAALSGAVALSMKKWFEGQISKLIDLPTKKEIFAAINQAVSAAVAGQKDLLEHVSTLSAEVSEIRNNHLQELTVRVAEIESRHETEDRLSRK